MVDDRVLAIVGPTAVGKTDTAVEICQALSGEIISIDSRQVYRGVSITSNAPTRRQLRVVSCHLVGVVDPRVRINAAGYVQMARRALDDVRARGALPVLTAGTGLYLKALLEGLDLGGVPSDPELRARLQARARANLPALVRRLQALDPAGAKRTDLKNPVRVVRRMELALGRRSLPTASQLPARRQKAVKIGLTAPRPVLYQWIEERFDQMLARGWRREVEALVTAGVDPRAQSFSGIGMAEMADCIEGRLALEEARAIIVRRTRNYAKRQLTWFRSDPEVRWYDVTVRSRSDIVEQATRMLNRR
jgi:tRNA dimethylallyltransferase